MLFCEHPSITRCLQTAGFPDVTAWSQDTVEVKHMPQALITWSSKETLLRSPEWVWLDDPLVILVRLPQSRGALYSLFGRQGSVQPAQPLSSRFRLLTHPLGQLLWSLNRFQEVLEVEPPTQLQDRLVKLRRFTTAHWPEWFKGSLNEIENCLEIAAWNEARIILSALLEVAGDVARLHVLASLLREANNLRENLGATWLAVRLVKMGEATMSDLVGTQNGDMLASWQDATAQWKEASAQLAVAGLAGGSTVDDAFSIQESTLKRLERLTHGMALNWPETVETDLQSLIQLLDHLEEIDRKIRERLRGVTR